MSFFNDFKNFAMRGNVLDLAVGVIIGGAFGKIISSLVTNVIMPPIGFILGGIDFKELFINLSDQPIASLAEAEAAKAPVIAYGLFLNSIIDFLIVAFCIFIIIRQANRLFPPAEVAPERKCPFCYGTIDKQATRCPHCTSQLVK
ncbi:MAG TPA: large-conductance mechanosensitive channel protein MscL [Candidatus Avacidaminococcus intestinavium]|uniref:Large-conductance mechanosensitive channel n=1 Tax=Candidatus Avacidaminococcus intestinavium TaxID=2840684 RepID=A0A9D1MQD6_9FIRM|nr:large-conductance mechanosensitive channel protein MscL [Candidatus Avacidaminococcus intestinavium]